MSGGSKRNSMMVGALVLHICLSGRLMDAAELRIAAFAETITIPVGHRCMGILPTRAVDVQDDLEARGMVLLSDQLPIVVVALDWCEVRNDAYDRWRNAIAQAVGTTSDRVLLSCLHQHDAPVTDNRAQAYLTEAGLAGDALFDPSFQQDCIQRTAVAAAASLPNAVAVTHLATGAARVSMVASSRRVVHPDGRIDYDRYSSSAGNEFMRQAPDGPIDSLVRVISFRDGDRAVVSLFCYATHPMSSYGKGHVSADFPGVARRLVSQSEECGFSIYLSGCSGDVTAGKYNDGSVAMRAVLGERLAAGMMAAFRQAVPEAVGVGELQFRSESLRLPFIDEPAFQRDSLQATLRSTDQPESERILAAMGLSTLD
ncbi:MAG: hypothetical protein KDA85_18425, partial [Planctomycetaceae bacterium]|nr:hypothetical protein [Planctomycetaceae bacterium]